MEKLKVLFASPEVVPYAKTGGLADVSGILPRVLAEMGHEIKVIMPKYGGISPLLLEGVTDGPSIEITAGGITKTAEIIRLRDMEIPYEILFVDFAPYFDRTGLYVDPDTGLDYTDNDDRFIYFCHAALKAMKALEWMPDIVHANDWQTGILPAFLSAGKKDDPFFAASHTVFTIHNMGYQGIFPPESFAKLELPKALFYPTGPFEFWGKVNFMKSAIGYSNVINTVSERYAVEIQSSDEFGCGLEGVLRSRNNDLYGIVNGVDYNIWSPSKDKLIPYKYSLSNLSGKRKNKVELVGRLGLPYRERAPLIGMITRLVDQKGLDIIALAADDILSLDLQMVVLGTGDKKYHDLLTNLQVKYPDKLRALLTYDNNMAHWIEAGADAFLMPSRYEPCGLNQMYSLKYGTVPIVRATGGLADTVADVDPVAGSGTGFVFHEYDPEDLLCAIGRAVDLYGKKRLWRAVMKEGMRQDFSWASSARKYVELYRKAMAKAGPVYVP